MKVFLTIIMVCIGCVSIAPRIYAQEVTFTGEISGLKNDTIHVLGLPLKLGETPIFDVIECVNGNFESSIGFNLNMWHLFKLRIDTINDVFGNEKLSSFKLKNREILFFMKPGDQISISANIAEYGINYQVYGNDISIQRNEVAKQLFPLEEKYNQLVILIEKLESSDQSKEFKDLNDKLQSVSEQISKLELEYIVKHPDWINSAVMIPDFPYDTITKYYENFNSEVKDSFFGRYVAKIINTARINSIAPEFILPDKKGNDISLSDFKGKYVVLYFWGTWCGYCIKDIPKLKEYYSKYQDKVEFISINCRDYQQAWLTAIDKYNMNWINLHAKNKKVPDNYGIEGYPAKIIIDKEGRIIFKSAGSGDEFYNKMDELFNK